MLQSTVATFAATLVAALPATGTGALDGVTVNVDPGHNPGNARNAARINRVVERGPIRKACDTVGTTDGRGFAEWQFNGQLATRLARRLRARGATVTFTRRNGEPAWGPCITGRADIGNRADVAISIHADGAAPGARGFHVIRPGFVRGWTGDITRPSSRLATRVRDALAALRGGIPPSTYAGRRGIDVRTDLGGLTLSDVPKVMVEHGNMRNARDARLLRSAREQERIAAALTGALVRWHLAERRAGGR
jgi:N-acetylmuramoyl-L-alanine amidase